MELLTLYLVDDEPIILKGLLETYDWEKMGFKVVGWARDGEEALEQIIERKPDVVLTDVRMKKMNGLTLIEKVKEQDVKTNFVVISAYRDFEYAQKACRNGALSYLVKPINDEELQRTMDEIYEMCTEKKFKEKNYTLWEKILVEDQDNFLNQMIGKYLDQSIDEIEIEEFFTSLSRKDEATHQFAVVVAGIDITQRVVNQKEFEMKQYLLNSALYKKISELYCVWSKKNIDGTVCYIVDFGQEKSTERLKSILVDLQREFKGDMISALFSNEKGLRGLRDAYVQALKLFEMACEAGAGSLLLNNSASVQSNNQYSLDVEAQILGAFRKNDITQLKKAYEKFIYTLPENEKTVSVYLRRLAVRVEFAMEDFGGVTEEMVRSFQNFYNAFDYATPVKLVNILYQLFQRLIELRESAEETFSEQYFKEYIPGALGYIRDHLSEETLSIGEVAEYVYLNPIYFGRLFKSVMKMSFKRYVQNMRMEKAKELLLEEGDSISGICEKVGIPNPSYFSQVFKQYTGTLPSEYKRSLEL